MKENTLKFFPIVKTVIFRFKEFFKEMIHYENNFSRMKKFFF